MTRLINRILTIVGIGTFVFLIYAHRSGMFAVRPYESGSKLTEVPAGPELDSGHIPVKIGIFAENVYGFDFPTQSLAVEGWVWIIWPEAFQKLMDADGVTIEKIMSPVNQVNSWDSVYRPAYTTPLRRQDGSYYQLISFSGRFYADNLDLHRYPFERIVVPISFGSNLMSDTFSDGNIQLIADAAQSGVGQYVDILGFVTDSFAIKSYIQHYPSGFGLRDSNGIGQTDFRQVRLEVAYKKSGLASSTQLILPLAVVMLIVIIAPVLAASLWEVRIAIPSTALLTLVFLQQSYRATLPALPYLTYLDQIYGSCYMVTFGLFGLFVWSSNKLDNTPEAERPAVIARLNRIDVIVQLFFIAWLILSSVANWYHPIKY
jgi:hypothetical protein